MVGKRNSNEIITFFFSLSVEALTTKFTQITSLCDSSMY